MYFKRWRGSLTKNMYLSHFSEYHTNPQKCFMQLQVLEVKHAKNFHVALLTILENHQKAPP